MPWSALDRPSPALGILRPLLDSYGVSHETVFGDFLTAQEIGLDLYRRIAAGDSWVLLPEWLFSRAAFPERFESAAGIALDELDDVSRRELRAVLRDHGEALGEFRDRGATAVAARIVEQLAGARAVAFTCSINQLVPALAVARLLKDRRPDVRVLLGGTQVEGDMGNAVLEVAPWIDAVYMGEAEVGLRQTMDWLLRRSPSPSTPFLSHRAEDGSVVRARDVGLLHDMDASPVPDYRPYIEHLTSPLARGLDVTCSSIPFVSSRGCWWGARSHCTFCGLNGTGLAFRAKSPERVYRELLGLAQDYQSLTLVGMDNIIPHGYFNTLLPRLAASGLDLDIRYEAKANLKRDQMRAFRDAGVRVIQPGIESLSDHSLELMAKGVTAIQNIQTLKLAGHYGIEPQWNLLFGFPGETDEDLLEQAALMPRLHHLPPPVGPAPVRVERFSPYHFEPERHGIDELAPLAGYQHVFPSSAIELADLAFYFDIRTRSRPGPSERAAASFMTACHEWQRRWARGASPPLLHYYRGPGFVEVRDRRHRNTSLIHRLEGLEAELLLSLDDRTGRRQLHERFGDPVAVDLALRALDRVRLILDDGRSVVGLPLPAPKGLDSSARREVFVAKVPQAASRAHRRAPRPTAGLAPTAVATKGN
ncbi:RiPP maturation radical SAM C-methyltransferase [Engelhardtia mirabilis]